jgi:hypothetical protein
MKSVLLTTLLLAASFQAHADHFNCSQNEAQFIGTVKDVIHDYMAGDGIVRCSFEIEFLDFKSSGICPLSELDATQTRYNAPSCDGLVEGSEISGYLIQKNGDVYIE